MPAYSALQLLMLRLYRLSHFRTSCEWEGGRERPEEEGKEAKKRGSREGEKGVKEGRMKSVE